MSQIVFNAFDKQANFLSDQSRNILVAAGKRGGKTECGAIKSIMMQETKPNWNPNSIDPYLGVIIAPTWDMLRRLSMKKFLAYADPFIKSYNKSTQEVLWHDGSLIYGLSADRPQRIEGIKANWGWLDEIFQMPEEIYLEMKARTADTKGYLWFTGSLGIQYQNPKRHWAYKTFKENKSGSVYEWATADNPHFPREELTSLQNTLDPKTYRSMFEINWDTPSNNLVYQDFDSKLNVMSNLYDKNLPVHVAVDWGWNHPTAVLFIQFDPVKDRVCVIDEIVKSQTKLEDLFKMIFQKQYHIAAWYCDPAGTQTREQTAESNVDWAREKLNIRFKWARENVTPSIAAVRSWIMTASGQRKLLVDERCKHLLDELATYRYDVKNGEVQEEIVKEHDDAVDALRYFFINHIMNAGPKVKTMSTWDVLKW